MSNATQAMTLSEFLLARIAEDEAAAKAVPPLGHNFDMGGNRQDERWIFGRSLPSSADGMGNWSLHRGSPTTAAHFARHDPARVLAECEAKRRIVERLAQAERLRQANFDEQTVASRGGIDNQEQISALRAHGWELGGRLDGLRYAAVEIAAVYADHADYRDDWKP